MTVFDVLGQGPIKKNILLNAAAIAVLRRLKARFPDSEWIVPGRRRGDHLKRLQSCWSRTRTAAGLEGVRVHDLRHSHASIAANEGVGLPIIGKLLGHTNVQTTARCAHLHDDPVKKASDAVGKKLSQGAWSGPGPASEVKLVDDRFPRCN